MANESITFGCPACGIKLTVPASLAGVTGPCPSCRTLIQAPIPAVPLQQAVQAAVPYQAPPPVSYAPTGIPSTPIPAEIPPYQPPPVPAAAQPGHTPSLLKPEPRQLPNRAHPVEVVAKQMPEPNHSGDSRKSQASPVPRHPKRTSPLLRIAMLLLFLSAAGVLVYGVVRILKMQPDQNNPGSRSPARSTTAPPAPPSPAPQPAPEIKVEPKASPIAALPTPATEQPTLIEPAPQLPEGVAAKSPAMEALAVLEKFIGAKSLAERLPLIETKTPEEELAKSCLAGTLPTAKTMVIEAQESNPVEEVVDFYYNVDFEAENNRINPQTILVRTRGRANPKVVVDPFLDLFGGRLAAYASKPSEKGGNFQVIVWPVASCLDPNIRDREKKLTLKLMARDNTKEIAQAYFSKVSKIGEILEDGTFSLCYGKAKACTVMLRWNTEESADHPYLEAIGLKAMDWNP